MQEIFKGVIFTKHAIERLYQRGIAQSDAWYTLRRPDTSIRGKTPGSFKFYKTYGLQRIEIIAKQNERREWVVLSCWSRMIGAGKPIFTQTNNFLWVVTKKILIKIWQLIRKQVFNKKRASRSPRGEI
ncbi:MAG TPA: DUF4258 domain-containing protein [Candidatus Bathyarchaeia archaeon]|nr:DUF4258 domain-containing protein [Candidatus Bathyarchaeia archaeon]